MRNGKFDTADDGNGGGNRNQCWSYCGRGIKIHEAPCHRCANIETREESGFRQRHAKERTDMRLEPGRTTSKLAG
ncbi:unnamed protein product, partial [Iphiclides podalirius]